MKAFVATGILGSFAFDAKGKIIHYRLFPRAPEVVSERLGCVRKGEIIPEEESLLKDIIKSGYKEVVWEKKIDFPGISCMYEPDNIAKTVLQKDLRKLALGLGWAKSNSELNKIMADINVLLTKTELRKPKNDRILMHAIGVADELDRVINTLSERMREWYGLYFPEAERLVQSHEQLARIIHEEGKREKVKDKKVMKYSDVSAGMPFSDDDLKAVQEYAKSVLVLNKTRDYASEYVKNKSREVIPNLSAVAGGAIASRLLSLAGGLEKLAKMSSSTIQLLGAEKALFRHLRGQGRSPKFGVIFAHPYVQKAPKKDKGKVARLLASKLTMAARADFYTGKDMGEKLLSDLKAKIKGRRPQGKGKGQTRQGQ